MSVEGREATPTQRAFWTLGGMGPSAGNEVCAIALEGPLDVGRLAGALDRLEERLDTLRTRLVEREGVLRTHVEPPRGGVLRIQDVGAAAVDASAEALAREPLGETGGPLVRATLLRVDASRAQLVIVAHHAVMDGRSLFALLPRAIAALYRGEEPDVDGFADWAAAAEAERRGEPGRRAWLYWQEALRDAPRSLALPTDRPRSSTRSLRGRRIERDAEVGAAELAAGGRPVDLALAALGTLVHRMADADELMVGVTHANRRAPGADRVVGCLVRTVPLRLSPVDAETVGELVEQIGVRRRLAFSHLSDVVDDVLASLRPEGSGPGYSIALNYMSFSERDALDFGPALRAWGWRPDPGWTGTDLAVDVIEDGERLRCVLEYDAALFEEVTARAWLDGFVSALEAIPRYLGVDLGALPLLDEEQRLELGWLGDGGGPAVRPGRIHDALAIGAREGGREPALLRGASTLDYRTLWRRAGAIADEIVALPGGPPPRLVGLGVADPLQAVVAMVGILRSGAAYVPLDPDLPRTRRAQMLEAARPIAVVTDAVRALPEGVPRIQVSERESEGPSSAGSPASAAYVIFTSGSTGRPKGVLVAHENVVHQMDARRALYGGAPGVTLSAHSYSFDAALACTLWALASGTPLVVVDESERRDPALLRQRIATHRVETLDVPPALWAELLADGREGLGSLRTVIVGGEALPPTLALRHRALLPEVRLVNEYGPTETTVFCTAHVVDAVPPGGVPIGRPIHRTQCRVVDRYGASVPRGGWGELWVAGAGVAAGYLGDAARTDERFVRDPEIGRAYRTGDRVRWDAEGRLVFAGRLDAQVQIRGYRVEPDEVVAALESLPSVSQAAVLAQDGPLGLQLHAWVVPSGDAKLEPAELRARLRGVLPEPMVPATITALEALPRAPSGKLDAARLPAPSTPAATPEGAGRCEPATQTEDAIIRAFREVLRLRDPVSVHASFFDLGGSSITAVRVLSRLHEALGVRVPLSVFVRAPSVASLAQRLHDDGLLAEEPLVVRIAEGDGPPLWLLHPVGGHVVYGERIARRMKAPIPLYGIQAQGLDGRKPPLCTMDEVAALYLARIREVQPHGPYYLAGPSQGGLAALEIAQRLRADREEVRWLAMLDCWAPGFPRVLPRARRLLDHVGELRRRAWAERVSYLREKVMQRFEHDPRAYRYREEGDEGAIYDTLLAVQSAYAEAADGYEVRPYDGSIHVFRAARVPRHPGVRFDDPTCGWARFARGGVVVTAIDGEHRSMLDPPAVEQLARELETHLLRLRPSPTPRAAHGYVAVSPTPLGTLRVGARRPVIHAAAAPPSVADPASLSDALAQEVGETLERAGSEALSALAGAALSRGGLARLELDWRAGRSTIVTHFSGPRPADELPSLLGASYEHLLHTVASPGAGGEPEVRVMVRAPGPEAALRVSDPRSGAAVVLSKEQLDGPAPLSPRASELRPGRTVLTVIPAGVAVGADDGAEERDAMIHLAAKLFYGTGVPACVLVLRPPPTPPPALRR